MKPPFDFLPEANRKPAFYTFLVGTLVLLALFQPVNAPLQTPAAPSGIVSLQLAWTAENARTMVSSWVADARLFAAFGLGFDYLFMPVYATALALGALLAAGRHPGWFARLGGWAATGAFLAAAFDALENLGQFHELFHARFDLAPAVGICAVLKFSLILVSLVYGLAGWWWPKQK